MNNDIFIINFIHYLVLRAFILDYVITQWKTNVMERRKTQLEFVLKVEW